MFSSRVFAPLLLFTALVATRSAGQTDFQIPALNAPVVDAAGLMTNQDRNDLDTALRDYFRRGGAQFALLTVNDLGGLTIEQASIKVAEKWKLGNEKADNGLLILVAKTERAVRIEVGQGLEGDIPDAVAKRVITEILTPAFQQGNFSGGVGAAFSELARRATPEIPFGGQQAYSQYRDNEPQTKGRFSLLKLIFFLVILFLMISTRFGRLILWSALLSGGRGGGGGGGGWGGGGGGFSGGGASGRW